MGKWDEIEDMPVYRDAVELAVIAERVAKRVHRVRPDLADNLRRASGSVVLNIGEGAREFAPREKARIYRISQRESGECRAGFDLLERIGLGDEDTREGRRLASKIIGQITGLCHAALSRLDPPPRP